MSASKRIRMMKFDIPIGEKFKRNGKQYEVKESIDDFDVCVGCSFYLSGKCRELPFTCDGAARNDSKDVIFVEVEQ